MSIKIKGTKGEESIFKEKDGSEVRIVPSLFLNGVEITASGGGSTDPGDTEKVCELKTCGIYTASKYAGYDKVKVNVSNWETVKNIPDNYYEINRNREYNVSQFTGYAGIVVTKVSEPDPELPEKEDISITFSSVNDIVQSSYKKEISFLGTIDYTNYDVQIKSFSIPIAYSFKESNGSEIYNQEEGTVTLSGKSTNFTGTVSTNTITIPHADHTTNITAKIDIINDSSSQGIATLQITRESEKFPNASQDATLVFNYDISKFTITISQTLKTQSSSTLSLRNPDVTNSTPTYENLVVNNDALIQGNLSVNGYINDLLWYWDSIAINAIETYLGTGFLAKITDLTFKINNEQVLVPTLQLSPGSSYKESNYSIIWMPTGVLKIGANNITDISGSIQVLRYA